jgi:hypothetical protein
MWVLALLLATVALALAALAWRTSRHRRRPGAG